MNRGTSRGAAVGLPASLLRLHRHGRANLLVTGGSAEQRWHVAHTLHRRSPLAHERFVAFDCVRDDSRIQALLQSWLLTCSRPEGSIERVGVLFLDSIGDLPEPAQRSLLLVARRLDSSATEARDDGPLRLMAGDRFELERAVAAGRFSPALLDHLDKIRVALDLTWTRGAA